MHARYLVTGAAGFLGSWIVRKLIERSAKVYAYALPGDPLAEKLPKEAIVLYGDVTDKKQLGKLFENADSNTCVIHCAGIISVASAPSERLRHVNVDGTKNVIEQCRKKHVAKLVYISSVHAIPEIPNGQIISEVACTIRADAVIGHYAKSKAEATSAVLRAAKDGQNASVAFPSGLVGPGDDSLGSTTKMLKDYYEDKLPAGVKGGYDFVDVRDAADGVIAIAERGARGGCYILSGHYTTIEQMLETFRIFAEKKKRVVCVPLFLARMIAPIYEKLSIKRNIKPFFTPYAVSVLGSNGSFSNSKAEIELGYTTRSLPRTIEDTVQWIKDLGKKKK